MSTPSDRAIDSAARSLGEDGSGPLVDATGRTSTAAGARELMHATLAEAAGPATAADVRLTEDVAALREALRCPVCREPLVATGEELRCTHPATPHSSPVVRGVPVLINETNSVFSVAGVLSTPTSAPSVRGAATDFIQRLVPSLHRVAKKRENYARFAGLLRKDAPEPKVLVIGGRVLGAGMERLLEHSPPIRLLETDVAFGPRTKLVCDAHDLPFASGTFDGVVVQAVLEHVADPYRCVEEIHRVLAPAGLVYAETPFMQQVHAGAHDFTRFTHLGHRRLFRDFEEIESGTGQGPGTALAWSYQYFLLSFSSSPRMRRVLRGFAQMTAFHLKYFDVYLSRKPGAFDASSGYFFLGRKTGSRLADRDLLHLYKGAVR